MVDCSLNDSAAAVADSHFALVAVDGDSVVVPNAVAVAVVTVVEA